MSRNNKDVIIEYNISQIARIFDVDSLSLLGQLRRHYPEIVPQRERERERMGISANLQYGARKKTTETYNRAIEVLLSSEMTIEEVADECHVSHTGLREYILAYHPEVTLDREQKCSGTKVAAEKYAPAIELLQTTSLSMADIAKSLSINIGSLRKYVSKHRADLLSRRYINA